MKLNEFYKENKGIIASINKDNSGTSRGQYKEEDCPKEFLDKEIVDYKLDTIIGMDVFYKVNIKH